MTSIARALLLSIAMAALPALAATEVRGVKFTDTLQAAQQSLKLNGAGVRVKIILDLYAAGLYVAKTDPNATAVIGQPGAKVMKIVLLRDLTGEDFADATVKGFKANNSEADVAKFQGKLEEIKALMLDFGPVKKGTVIQIDFVPGEGTHVLLDGKRRGPEVTGDDFQQAVLRIWLGPKPVDSDLKQSLLGGK
ncbi:MAG: chalcone isomerase family protein [Aquabacterium sp.]|uniref:chalcone isomerase family protein n=1 Tax=Aquabacterium sp. TaxID=1872578 RepID=UPI002721FE0E|nr:chalcone isomerase family protein [Aquabacterium sp.]MDO9003852.1 chalcone isomerase family protein [Aquabacterium sp.]